MNSYSTGNNVSSSSSSAGGVGVVGLLGVAFVVLKLIGVIDWSWWLVTLPFWGGLALALVILITILVGWLLTRLVKRLRRR